MSSFDPASAPTTGAVGLPSGLFHAGFTIPSVHGAYGDRERQVCLAYRNGADSATAVNPNAEVNAKAQLWREIGTPDSFRVSVIDNRRVKVVWANRHRQRSIDSTEIWRNAGAGWQRVATRGFLDTTFTDSVPLSGTHGYTVRHVTGTLTYVSDDVGLLSRPNSPAPPDTTVTTLGPPAPTGLLCEGNFAPTIDCRWFNTIATDSTQIVRDGVPQATVAPGVISWTDGAVTRHNT